MRIHLILIWILFLALISLPFVYAAQAAGPDFVFGGFLLNPIDGNTYLAKMYQGWRGEWRFQLPYTAQPGEGAYLFLFYIFLGHLARLTGIPLLVVFHLARLVVTLLLMIVLWRFLPVVGVEPPWRTSIYAWLLFGSGMGWLLFPFGLVTSDFLVPETYPFLSAFVNPHFTLGLALLLVLFWAPSQSNSSAQRHFLSDWSAGLVALLLAVVDPFGVAIALVVLGGLLAVRLLPRFAGFRKVFKISLPPDDDLAAAFSTRQLLVRLGWVAVFGLPVLLYDVLVSNLDPLLAGWNAQNLTPSPPVWDLLLSLSPALILAAYGSWWVLKNRQRKAWLLVIWLAVALVLIYLPFGLQRRFMKGLYVPVVGLAAFSLVKLAQGGDQRVRRLLSGVFMLSILSNVLVLSIAFYGVQTHDPLLYLTVDEAQAMDWLEDHSPPDALVLASAQTGLFIPAHTGRRVIYGHPFETLNASEEQEVVDGFFATMSESEAGHLLVERAVDYVFYGPREVDLGEIPPLSQLQPVYRGGDVTVYQVLAPDLE